MTFALGVGVGAILSIVGFTVIAPRALSIFGRILVEAEREHPRAKHAVLAGVSLATLLSIVAAILSSWLVPGIDPWAHPDFMR